jgi:YD repeat-containing protein
VKENNDSAGRHVATQNALGIRTSNVYDGANRRIALIDGNSNRFCKSEIGSRKSERLRRARFPCLRSRPTGGGETSMAYGVSKTITRQRHKPPPAGGRRPTGAAPLAGANVKIPAPITAAQPPPADGGNRLTKATPTDRVTSTYDAANRLNTATDAGGTTTYTFDADGNQVATEEPSGDVTTNTWDVQNQLTQPRPVPGVIPKASGPISAIAESILEAQLQLVELVAQQAAAPNAPPPGIARCFL